MEDNFLLTNTSISTSAINRILFFFLFFNDYSVFQYSVKLEL